VTEYKRESGTLKHPLRIGCINIMPEAHTYEPFLVSSLDQRGYRTELTWIRLKTHAYRSTPSAHLTSRYVSFEAALAGGPLDGLILTGAPVETFPFPSITYWPELSDILTYARDNVPGTLGLCWGAIALGKAMGMEEEVYEKKLFGVFPGMTPVTGISLGDEAGRFHCPHSRFAGISTPSLERAVASGDARILGTDREIGPFIFESSDRRFLGHMGHPEYPVSRLVHEWERDREKGRPDVMPPAHFDPEKPENTWKIHTTAFFSYWLETLSEKRENEDNKIVSSVGRGEL
jgi:homoserine O-succinyltransferase/O-acetyltransferase